MAALPVSAQDVVTSPGPLTVETGAVVDQVRELFPQTVGWFRIVHGATFVPDSEGRLIPDYRALTHPRVRWQDGSGHTIVPRYGESFGRPGRVESGEDQGIYVDLTPLDAADPVARIEDGIVVYPGAFRDTDVLLKATPTHVDEYLMVRSREAPTRWRYRFSVGPGLAGIRQAGNSIEAVDAEGRAWLRATQPRAVDRDHKRVEGTIRVEGDVIVIEIDLSELTMPVLVDPDWRSTGDMSFGRFYHQSNLLPDGRVLSTGGCTSSVCSGDLTIPSCPSIVLAAEALSLDSRTFSRLSDSPVSRYFHVAESLPDGSVVLSGGCQNGDCTVVADDLEIFDYSTLTFRPVGTLPEALAGSMGMRLRDGTILIAGGCTRMGCTRSAWIFDPDTEMATPTGEMVTARGRAPAVMLMDGRVLVAGGCSTIMCDTVLRETELYDPSTGTWSAASPMAEPRGGHYAAALLDGGALIGGGCVDQLCRRVLRSTEVFDPVSNGFRAGPDMAMVRFGAVATLLPDGTVMVNQGCQNNMDCDLTNEVYRPLTDDFVMIEEAVTPRAFQTLTLHLPRETVIANGGCQPRTCSWWVETWDTSMLGPAPDGGMALDGGTFRDAGTPPTPDAGTPPPGGGGGCCSVAGADRRPDAGGALLAVLVAGVLLRRRRR